MTLADADDLESSSGYDCFSLSQVTEEEEENQKRECRGTGKQQHPREAENDNEEIGASVVVGLLLLLSSSRLCL